MGIEQDVQREVEASVKKGKFPDKGAAVAGLQKQLIELQKGALKDALKDVEPASIDKKRDEVWKSLLEAAGGDEEKAAQMYADRLKKITG